MPISQSNHEEKKNKAGGIQLSQLSHFWIFIQKNNKKKKLIQKDTCTPLFITVLFTIAKI